MATPGNRSPTLKFKIIFLETGHSQARTGSLPNHVNIAAIDNSVRFDIVPKI